MQFRRFGNVNIDVRRLKIDSLSLSSHKFYGPKGVGALYVRDGIMFNRQNDGGHQERDKRAGTENTAGIVGTGKAIELATENLSLYTNHLKTLSEFYLKEVNNRIPNIKINGDLSNKVSGNNNICFAGIDGNKLVSEVDRRGISTSSGSACSAGLINPSYVLLSMGINENLARRKFKSELWKRKYY